MPHTIFHVDVLSVDFDGPLKESDFTPTGCDEISMSIQGHRDAPKVALGKGASGGEMSRIMLALEVVIAASAPVEHIFLMRLMLASEEKQQLK
jgi:DNA repair protein RecN (Recombination protein N)